MQVPLHTHFLSTLVRINALWINSRAYSIATDIGSGLMLKHFRLSHKLLDDSALATVLILALVFGSIQKSAASVPVPTETDVTTTYSSSLTISSPIFSRHANQMEKYYYFETIQVSVSIMGTYTFISNSPIDTYGYLYRDQFNPVDLSLKLISENDDSNGQGQFRITAILQSGQIYVLVVTTFTPATTGQFSIVSSGLATVDMYPARMSIISTARRVARSTPVISSMYSGILSSRSPIFSRPNGAHTTDYYYYQALWVTIYTNGTYSFASRSSMDTYGYLYNNSFNPSYPLRNLIASNDDNSGGQQFQIIVSLVSWRTYVLVVTTYGTRVTGNFSIIVLGPASVDLISFRPSITTTPPVVSPIYLGILSSSSPTFSRLNGDTNYYYYYETIRVMVFTSGTYYFTSHSSMDTYGYFYNNSFNPSYPSQNLITSTDDNSGGRQFRMNVYLVSGRTYVLVVTTYGTRVTGNFSIIVLGPASVDLISFRPSITPTSSVVSSIYSGSLSSSSLTFSRLGNDNNYYYQAIRVTISTNGTYSFGSNSSMYTYCYFYYDSFDPSYPSQNLITSNDDHSSTGQFGMNVSLTSELKYVLVVTTYGTGVTGSFSVTVLGPTSVGLTSFSPSTTDSPCYIYGTCDTGNRNKTATIVGITLGCITLCLIICGVCVYKYKQKKVSIPESNLWARNQIVPANVYPMAYVDRNVRRINVVQMPYTISMAAACTNSVEEPPPSYNVAVASLNAQERWNSHRF